MGSGRDWRQQALGQGGRGLTASRRCVSKVHSQLWGDGVVAGNAHDMMIMMMIVRQDGIVGIGIGIGIHRLQVWLCMDTSSPRLGGVTPGPLRILHAQNDPATGDRAKEASQSC